MEIEYVHGIQSHILETQLASAGADSLLLIFVVIGCFPGQRIELLATLGLAGVLGLQSVSICKSANQNSLQTVAQSEGRRPTDSELALAAACATSTF